MSVLHDPAQIAIGEEVRRTLASAYGKQTLLGLLETSGAHDKAFWSLACAQGWTGITLPEEFGGLGLGLLEAGLVWQACGAFTVGAPFLSTSFAFADTLNRLGSADQRARWLPRLASGELIGTLAFAERGSTLAPLPMCGLEAAPDGSLRLNGLKPMVPAGLVGDLALVWARLGQAGALVLVDLTGPGVTRTARNSFDNSRCAGDLAFQDCPVTLLAEGPAAFDSARACLARLAILVAHEQIGGAQILMETARDYANQRKAFGQVIGAFQSVKHRIAEMYALIELARANAIHAAALADTSDLLKAAAAARLSACEAYDTCARDCTQIHGGIGVTWDLGLHLHMRRARTLAMEAGPPAFWEDLLVDELTLSGQEANA